MRIGALVGIIVTAILQSSGVVTVLLVGMTSAGVLRMRNAISILLGANIGTTITGIWMAAGIDYNPSTLMYLLIFAGAILNILLHQEQKGHYGRILLGMGTIFLGLHTMGQSMKFLTTMIDMHQFMSYHR